MLQIIPITTRKPEQVDSNTIKYIENVDHDSMTKKYNRAIEQFVLNSKEDIICFRHEDTEIRTSLGACEYKVRKLTEDRKVAVVGLIGTIALDNTCIWWSGVVNAGGRGAYGAGSIIQGGRRPKMENGKPVLDADGKMVAEAIEYPMNDYPGCHDYMATVDGCCMFFPKWFFEKGFRFDKYLSGYHFYDADICLQALAAGYKVSTCDIVVKHDSQGPMSGNFEKLKTNFYNKWNAAVDGKWPISRFSKFDMSKIKMADSVKKDNKPAEIQDDAVSAVSMTEKLNTSGEDHVRRKTKRKGA